MVGFRDRERESFKVGDRYVHVLPNSHILCLFMPCQIPKVPTFLLLHLGFLCLLFICFCVLLTELYIFFSFTALFVDSGFKGLGFKWVCFYLMFCGCMWCLRW